MGFLDTITLALHSVLPGQTVRRVARWQVTRRTSTQALHMHAHQVNPYLTPTKIIHSLSVYYASFASRGWCNLMSGNSVCVQTGCAVLPASG